MDEYFLQKHGVNLLHIESRSCKKEEGSYEFFVEADSKTGDENFLNEKTILK
jgi:prephenate dehydratase